MSEIKGLVVQHRLTNEVYNVVSEINSGAFLCADDEGNLSSISISDLKICNERQLAVKDALDRVLLSALMNVDIIKVAHTAEKKKSTKLTAITIEKLQSILEEVAAQEC